MECARSDKSGLIFLLNYDGAFLLSCQLTQDTRRHMMNIVIGWVQELPTTISTHAYTHTQPFYGSLDFVFDNLVKLVPE